MAEVSKVKLVFYLVSSVLLITFVFYGYQIVYTPNILVDREDQLFIVRNGNTYRQVQENLAKGRFVNDFVSFSFLARLMDYDKEIKPGRFILRRNMTNIEAIRVLRAGIQEPVSITFTHVRLLSELGDKITKNTGVSSEEFYDALDEFVSTQREGFTQETILCICPKYHNRALKLQNFIMNFF